VTGVALSLRELSRRALDKRYGLFRGLGETPRQRHGGEVFIMGGEIVDPKYFSRFDKRRPAHSGALVAGAGLTREEALWSALGEGIERYSAQIPQESRVASFVELGAAAIDPRAFILYSERQYRSPDFTFKRFDPGAPYSWIEARDLRSGEYRLAPLQIAALGAELHAGETPLCQPISTGIAAHSRRESALLTGLLEVIERDAFMATWQLRRAPPQIAIDEALRDELGPRVAGLVQHVGLRIDLYLLSTDNTVPVVLCAIRRADNSACVVGAAARLRLSDAITKALVEAWHTWVWGLSLEGNPAVEAGEIVEFEQHVRHYFEPGNQGALAFLDEGERISVRDIPDEAPTALADLVERLDALGHEVFSVNLTSPDVAALGFVVYRVMVSNMQPLACGVRNYPLDDRRLRKLAAHWAMPMPAALNLDPHPFP
jgi:thiazole/oxazole-forming peptide maturase SagD family component